ncbi:MAG TPA: hypothetical protein VNV13_01980, partial [Steroidobacteraceae bacterium]|nr:hypothetical protein [Steroidobacteraceae bacterium]
MSSAGVTISDDVVCSSDVISPATKVLATTPHTFINPPAASRARACLPATLVVPASGCGYLTQSCAIFAAFTTPPTTSRKVIINTLVNALLNGSTDTWDKMDVLYVMAAADSQAASINWKNPGTTTLAN